MKELSGGTSRQREAGAAGSRKGGRLWRRRGHPKDLGQSHSV